MYICICNGITDNQVRHCVKQGACCLADLQAELGVAAGCGACAAAAAEILREERAPQLESRQPGRSALQQSL